MDEPHYMFGYLLIVFMFAAGTATILSAWKIERFFRRWNERELARIKDWHPFFKFSVTLPLSISPELHVLNIRFGGALMILFALVLLGLAIRANM